MVLAVLSFDLVGPIEFNLNGLALSYTLLVDSVIHTEAETEVILSVFQRVCDVNFIIRGCTTS